MDSYKALAILAFCAGTHAAALPQFSILPLAVGTATAVGAGPATGSAAAGIVINKPAVTIPTPPFALLGGLSLPTPSPPSVPSVASPAIPSIPIAVISLPAVPSLAVPSASVPGVSFPAISSLPIPAAPVLPPAPALNNLPVPAAPSGLSSLPVIPQVPTLGGSLPSLPTGDLPGLSSSDALSKVVQLGTTVLEVILGILQKGAASFSLPSGAKLPVSPALPNVSLPLNKRQLGGLLGGLTSSPAPGAVGTVANTLGSVPSTGGLTTGLTSGSSPLGGVTNTVASVPAVAGAASGLTGGTKPPGTHYVS